VVQTVDAVGTPKGVYAMTGEATQMQVQADVRIQRFANTRAAAFGPGVDSALNVGFFTADPASSPFAALYVSATTHEWRLAYSGVNSNGNFDVGTGRFADPERWYTVSFAFQEAGYTFAARVADTLTGDLLFLNTVSFTAFQPAATDHFNAALQWGPESSATMPPTLGQATLPSLMVFDNVSASAVPEPPPLGWRWAAWPCWRWAEARCGGVEPLRQRQAAVGVRPMRSATARVSAEGATRSAAASTCWQRWKTRCASAGWPSARWQRSSAR